MLNWILLMYISKRKYSQFYLFVFYVIPVATLNIKKQYIAISYVLKYLLVTGCSII